MCTSRLAERARNAIAEGTKTQAREGLRLERLERSTQKGELVRVRRNELFQPVCPYGNSSQPSSTFFLRASAVPSRTASLRPAPLADFTMAGSDNPFVNADAWRKHPLLNGTWKHIAPGFFIGLTAFGVFYAYDKATSKKTSKH